MALAALFVFIALNVAMPRMVQALDPSTPALQTTKPIPKAAEKDEDLLLYDKINKRVAEGEGYYPVAASEHRANRYPLKPFITVRLPTMALLAASIGPTGLKLALWSLIFATACVWWKRLGADFPTERHRPLAPFLIGLTMAARPEMTVLHESWAGVLILLSIGLHNQHRWWPSVAAGFLAVAFRETALPFVLLMMAFALLQRRWSESAGWFAALCAEAAYLAWHAAEVAKVVLPNDPASQGWMLSGGWPYAFDFLHKSSALHILPEFASQVLLSLTLFGWLAWKQFAGLATFLLICGYALTFMIIGRPENFYWGMLVGPVLLGGLAFVPRGLRDLWTESGAGPWLNAMRTSRTTVSD